MQKNLSANTTKQMNAGMGGDVCTSMPAHATSVDEIVYIQRTNHKEDFIGRTVRVVSQAQFQIGASPQKAENLSYFKRGPSKG